MLDARDLDIIAALQDDARATYADVAAKVGMSASAVHERVRKLEQQQVIQRLHGGGRPPRRSACW